MYLKLHCNFQFIFFQYRTPNWLSDIDLFLSMNFKYIYIIFPFSYHVVVASSIRWVMEAGFSPMNYGRPHFKTPWQQGNFNKLFLQPVS